MKKFIIVFLSCFFAVVLTVPAFAATANRIGLTSYYYASNSGMGGGTRDDGYTFVPYSQLENYLNGARSSTSAFDFTMRIFDNKNVISVYSSSGGYLGDLCNSSGFIYAYSTGGSDSGGGGSSSSTVSRIGTTQYYWIDSTTPESCSYHYVNQSTFDSIMSTCRAAVGGGGAVVRESYLLDGAPCYILSLYRNGIWIGIVCDAYGPIYCSSVNQGVVIVDGPGGSGPGSWWQDSDIIDAIESVYDAVSSVDDTLSYVSTYTYQLSENFINFADRVSTALYEQGIAFDNIYSVLLSFQADFHSVFYRTDYIDHPILPEGYQELEYIVSTGLEYINTFVPADQISRVDLVCDFVPTTYASSVYGARSAYGVGELELFVLDNQIYYAVGDSFFPIDASYLIDSHNGFSLSLDGTLHVNGHYVCGFDSVVSTSDNVYLFAVNNSGVIAQNSITQIYACDIYDGRGVLVRHYIPALRADGVIGLFDTFTGTFFTNCSGAGSFFGGSYVHHYEPEYTSWLQIISDKISSISLSAGGDLIVAPGYDDTVLLSKLTDIENALSNIAVVDVCDHEYTADDVQPATCILPGLTVYTCDYCGDSYSEIVDPYGHDWLCTDHVPDELDENDNVISAGYDVYTCSRCQEVYKDFDGSGAPDAAGDTIFSLITKVFSRLGSLVGGIISGILDYLDNLLTRFDDLISDFNTRTQQVVSFGGDYPLWLAGFWGIIPEELQIALGFCVVALILGILGKKLVFS